jgi:hypothetical protein
VRSLRLVTGAACALVALGLAPIASAHTGSAGRAIAFAAAGTAADATGAKGPCALAVAGSQAGTVAGHGSVVGIAQELAAPASACGPIGSVEFEVTGGAVTPIGAVVTVRVTQSDEASTPVGKTGTIALEPNTDTIIFKLGNFTGVFGPRRSVSGTVERRAWVDVSLRPAATSITEVAATGAAVTDSRRFGPCVTALAATRSVSSVGAPQFVGGGSLQALGGTGVHGSVPADPGQSTCNGGTGSLAFDLTPPLGGDGTQDAHGALRITDTTVPAKTPVGTIGSYAMLEAGRQVLVGAGTQSGAWGQHDAFGSVERRAGVDVATRLIGPGSPTPATTTATAFSAAATAIDTYGTKGPCSLAVAGWTRPGAIDAKGTIVGIRNSEANPQSICGAIGSVHYVVTATTVAGPVATLTVQVTQSDSPTTPNGSMGTIVLNSATQYVTFSIAGFCCAFGPGHSMYDSFDERADVRIATLTGVTALTRFAGAGTEITNDHRFGPCTFAVAGIRATRPGQPSTLVGGGSYAAIGGYFPGGDLANSACNGGAGAFGVDTEQPLASDGAVSVYALIRATESSDPFGAPVGTPGAVTLYSQNSLAQFSLGTHSGEWAENDVYGGFVIRRSAVEIGDWNIDPDSDGDPTGADNCASVANPDQLDTDGDGIGDECDATPGTTPGGGVTCGGSFEHSRFAFDLSYDRRGSYRGRLGFDDDDESVHFTAGDPASVVVSGDRATIRGSGTANGRTVGYRIDVRGSGAAGTFRIELSNGYANYGTFRGGTFRFR